MSYFNEGNKLYNTHEYKKAIDFYKKAVKENDNQACSYYNAGVCFIKLKEYYSAIEMLKKALDIQRESKYFFNLGYCYAMEDTPKKALIYFNMAWALNNADTECEKAINLLVTKYKKH